MAAIFYSLATLKDKLQSADKERGATAVEYALVIGLVSIAFIIALIGINGSLNNLINSITTWLDGQTVTSA